MLLLTHWHIGSPLIAKLLLLFCEYNILLCNRMQ